MNDHAFSRPASDAAARERVARFLDEHGLAGQVLEFDSGATGTSLQAAEAVGCELGAVVKSLVLVSDGRAIVALVAGDRRADAAAIGREVGGSRAAFADEETVREATGYRVGGVSPFDLPPELPVLMDESLSRFEVVYTAAGTANSMVPLAPDTLLRLSRGRVARISRHQNR